MDMMFLLLFFYFSIFRFFDLRLYWFIWSLLKFNLSIAQIAQCNRKSKNRKSKNSP